MSLAFATLLRIQHGMAIHARAYLRDPALGLTATLAQYAIQPPDPAPTLALFDEPPAGSPSFYRFGSVSIESLGSADQPLYQIDMDIECYADAVQGRALALVMADVIERAFAPRDTVGEPTFAPASLQLTEADGSHSESDVTVTDIMATDWGVTVAQEGQAYLATISYEILASAPPPLREHVA